MLIIIIDLKQKRVVLQLDNASRWYLVILECLLNIKSNKSRHYRIHPTYAGLSFPTAVLIFSHHSNIDKVISRNLLLIGNAWICFISALSARALENTMLGNASAKKWGGIQGNLSMLFAVLVLPSFWFWNLVVHLNWSILFVNTLPRRMYVLCSWSQFSIKDSRT